MWSNGNIGVSTCYAHSHGALLAQRERGNGFTVGNRNGAKPLEMGCRGCPAAENEMTDRHLGCYAALLMGNTAQTWWLFLKNIINIYFSWSCSEQAVIWAASGCFCRRGRSSIPGLGGCWGVGGVPLFLLSLDHTAPPKHTWALSWPPSQGRFAAPNRSSTGSSQIPLGCKIKIKSFESQAPWAL